MIDPFIAPPIFLVTAVQPIAERLSLSTLPLHAHEVLFAWACYHFGYTIISPIVSNWLFSKTYSPLPARTKLNWNVRTVSFVQSTVICALTVYVRYYDEELRTMDWKGRLWGYSGAGGMVQAFAAGYFLWDVAVSAAHIKILGPGSLAHAISALLVTSLGFVSNALSYMRSNLSLRLFATLANLNSAHSPTTMA